MAGAGAITLTDARVVEQNDGGVSMLLATVDVTNVSAEPIAEGEVYLFASAEPGQGQATTQASQSLYVPALAPGEAHQGLGVSIQLDAGTWHVRFVAMDTASSTEVASTGPVDGYVTSGEFTLDFGFDSAATYAVRLAFDSVEQVGLQSYRVHYSLTNAGEDTIPSGLPIVLDFTPDDRPADGGGAQLYHLEYPCTPGETQAKFLTLQLEPVPGTFTLLVDPGGASEASYTQHVTFTDDGTPTLG